MNIFILDEDPKLCAKYHCDKHVVKMITEHTQMLSTVCRANGFDIGYKSTHKNHPCTIWVGKSIQNYNWLVKLTHELHKEWQLRYNHMSNHKAYNMMLSLPVPKLADIGLTEYAQAMPEHCKNENPIQAYRTYYKIEKQHLLKFTNRESPYWLFK